MTVAYGHLLVAEPYGFPPARERRENEKALCQWRGLCTCPDELMNDGTGLQSGEHEQGNPDESAARW